MDKLVNEVKKLKNLLRKNKSRVQHILIPILVFLNLFILLKPNLYFSRLSGSTPLLDFDAYITLVKSAKEGLNPYTSKGMTTLGPPPVLLYFYPFSFVKIEIGRSLTTLLNIVSGFWLCFLLAKNYYPKRKVLSFLILLALLFSSFPVRFSIGMGQPGLFIALLITCIVINKKNNINSLFLVILSVIKSFFVVSLLAFLKNNRKVVLTTLVFLSAIVLITFSFLKPEWYLYYITNNLTRLFSTHATFSWPDYYNQSLGNTLYRLSLGNLYRFLFLPLSLLSGVAIFLTSNFALSIVITVILSPVSWQHYYVVIFPIFVMLFATLKKSPKSFLLILISFFLWWIEFPWMHQANFNLLNGLLASHYFFSGLILSLLLVYKKK